MHGKSPYTPKNNKRTFDALQTAEQLWNAGKGAKRLYDTFKKPKTSHKKRVVHQESHSDTIKTSHAFVPGSKLTDSQKRLFQNSNKAEYQYVNSFSLASNAGVSTDPSKHVVGNIQETYSGLALTGTLVPMTYAQTTASSGLDPGIANQSVEVLVKKVEYTLEFVNMSPGSQFVTIYVVKSRNDTGALTVTPSAVWETAVDAESGTAGAAATSSLWPFGRPTPNKGFKDKWNTIHTYDCTMNPGEARRHVMEIGINKTRNYGDLLTNQGYLEGITHYILLVARGTPGDTSNAPTAGTIMFMPTKLIGVVGVKQYVATSIKQSKVLNQFNNLPTVGVTALYGINDDSGQAVNVNLATNYG